MAKRQNWQLVKKDQTYTISDLAELFDMSPSGIKYWVKMGLRPINPGKGKYYFSGEDAIEFVKEKNKRHKLSVDIFKCFSCKGRNKIKSDEVTIQYTDITLGNDDALQVKVIGNCANCGGTVTKLWSDKKLEEFLQYYPGIKIIKEVKSNN